MRPAQDRAELRAWLEYVAQAAIDMLDDLDAADEDREDDELEIVTDDDTLRIRERRCA